MSLPYRFMPASSRSVSRAPRPHCATPAAFRSLQNFGASADRQHDFPAILAGVTGASDEVLAELTTHEGLQLQRFVGVLADQRRRLGARIRALHGDHRRGRCAA